MALKSGRVGIHPSQVDPITGMLLNGPTPGDISFEDLSDAEISSPEVGQTLQYNGTGWENVFASIAPTTLAALQDVDITDPQDGDYLVYDDENDKWVNSGSAPTPTYTDVTCTFYGAVEDIISFTDAAGVSHLVTFATDASSKQETFKIDPSGSSITFTSSVAKNPADLTEPFSKTLTITSATTDIEIFPVAKSKMLYWWGYMSDNCESLSTGNGWTPATNYTFTAPTFNKNSFYVTTGSNTISGIGNKSSIDVTKMCVIAQGVTISGVRYGAATQTATKAISWDNWIEITSNSLTKYEKSITGSHYITLLANASRALNGYALWYE